jgi:N-dimethylarginine dimethylaminohydrolase
MHSKNEWGKLNKVIVGHAHNATVPEIDISLRHINYADVKDELTIPAGKYPQIVVDEANEDLTTFVNFLEKEGVDVVRPDITDCNYYNYCPRDSVIVYKDKAIATPMPLRARRNEYQAYERHLENIHPYDIMRSDELYLVSNSGNKSGANLLQSIVDAKVHLLEDVYSYMHIDSTVAFLREGLMLLNPSRVKSIDMMPKAFRNWDYIMCPDPVDIGYYAPYNNSSPWISMNLFSVNKDLVALEEHQVPLQRELEKYGIESAMLPMRHAATLGGCFHCVTLDLDREDD